MTGELRGYGVKVGGVMVLDDATRAEADEELAKALRARKKDIRLVLPEPPVRKRR